MEVPLEPPPLDGGIVGVEFASMFQDVGGSLSTNLMRTIDLMLLKPYFQGTTRRMGAPFWFGISLP